ncbi:MAG: proprotein convertase P-domain-containing protein [Deltaproteobacteria bacterium]|nr:proprotein convertase P-domain-containing protein [Deltaproteobacteria bacterium]
MRTAFLFVSFVLVACGPAARDGGPGGGGDDDDQPPTGTEACTNAVDDDGDGRADCSDPDCSGIDGCPVCGAVENPEAQPLALPDGVGTGAMCSTDAQCTDPASPNCVAKECHASYNSQLNFIGFPDDAKLADPSKLLKVCVKMEHSWVRDLQIELLTPDGAVFILHKFVDRTGGEIFLGMANDADAENNPIAGTGMDYCWTQTAQYTFLEAPTVSMGGSDTLPAGDYKSVAPWTALTGSSLNGTWEMRVTDLWGIDNGFLFSWSIAFDPTLVTDCAGPIIL